MGAEADWNHLRSLLAVARGGTFTAAARTLGVKHSTISRHLGELEDSIRATIVGRAAGGLRLTSAGERLVAAAEAMEHQFQQARDDIAGRDPLVGGTVRIGAPDGFGALFLAPRLPRLTGEHPALTVQLMAMPRIFNLTKREADIAIALAVPEHGRLLARKLGSYRLGLYASADYLAGHDAIEGSDDLRRHRFITYIDDQLFTPELDTLDEVSPGARVPLQSSNIVAQAQAAAQGGGLCILPYFIAKQVAGLRPVLAERTRIERTWFMLIHEDQHGLARIRTVSEFLAAEVAASAAFFNEP